MNDSLKGITLNGVDLASQLKSGTIDIPDDDPVSEDVDDEFRKNHHIYKTPKTHCPNNNKGRRSKAMNKWSEVNLRNKQHNIVSAIHKNDIKKAIVSVILCLDEFKTLTEIFDIIEDVAKKNNLKDKIKFSAHSLRNPMGHIMKTEFRKYLDTIERSRESRKYRLNPVYKDKFNIDIIMDVINTELDEILSTRVPGRKEKVREVKEPETKEKGELASFSLPTENGTLEVKIFGKIQIEFSFK